EVEDGDPPATRGEPAGHRFAEARSSTGRQQHLVFEAHPSPPWLICFSASSTSSRFATLPPASRGTSSSRHAITCWGTLKDAARDFTNVRTASASTPPTASTKATIASPRTWSPI